MINLIVAIIPLSPATDSSGVCLPLFACVLSDCAPVTTGILLLWFCLVPVWFITLEVIGYILTLRKIAI